MKRRKGYPGGNEVQAEESKYEGLLGDLFTKAGKSSIIMR
jgi:hypothetical protein